MGELENIVVGIDFSPHSKNALREALRLARRDQARVHALHVIESQALSDLADALGVDPTEMQTASTTEARRKLSEMLSEIGGGEADVQISVQVGHPFYEILQMVQKVSANTLVLGSRGVDCVHPGASILVARCIRKAATEVLIVRKAQTGAFKKVCAFVDFSPESPRVLERAIRIARIEGAALVVCHVFLPPWEVLRYRSSAYLPSSEEQERYRAKLRAKIESILKPFEAEAREIGVEYQLLESTENEPAIEDFVTENGVDLVVINTRGRTGLKIILMGTRAEHVIRTSPCSVLAIKPEGFRYEMDSFFAGLTGVRPSARRAKESPPAAVASEEPESAETREEALTPEERVNAQVEKWEREHGVPVISSCCPDKAAAPRKPVIAICPAYGCGSRLVAEILRRRTGYEHCGFRLIDKVAKDMNVRRFLIDRMDQRALTRMEETVERFRKEKHIEQRDYFHHLIHVLRGCILSGGCILIGRGAPFLVEKGIGLRVRLTASREKRIENVMRFYGVDAAEAERRLEAQDQDRAAFVSTCFGKDIHDMDEYDLTVNLDRLKPDAAADAILRALEVMEENGESGRLGAESLSEEPESVVARQIEKWEREVGKEQEEMWREEAENSLPPARLPVVAVSRLFCSGSRVVGETIHSRLGYEVFGYNLIHRVAEDLRLSARVVERLDQKAESGIRAMMDALLQSRRVSREDYFRSLVRVMRALIIQGGVVLLGRGAPFLVEKGEGLRVSLTAPLEKRLENLRAFYGVEGGEAALKKLRETDAHRAEFVRQYFGADRSDPNHFDLTINTDRIPPAGAAEIVLRTLESFME